jgi:hypothetical protein
VRARHGDEDRALAAMKAENEAKLLAWGTTAPEGDTGKIQRRQAISAQVQEAQPGAQARHVATATGLAAGIAEAGREHEAERASIADAKAVQRATQRAAATLTESDRAAFLGTEPASEPSEPPAPEAAEERESLADYL